MAVFALSGSQCSVSLKSSSRRKARSSSEVPGQGSSRSLMSPATIMEVITATKNGATKLLATLFWCVGGQLGDLEQVTQPLCSVSSLIK